MDDNDFDFLSKDDLEYENYEFLLSVLDDKGISVDVKDEQEYFVVDIEGRKRYAEDIHAVTSFLRGVVIGMRVLSEKIAEFTWF